jgi:hypothetical protein
VIDVSDRLDKIWIKSKVLQVDKYRKVAGAFQFKTFVLQRMAGARRAKLYHSVVQFSFRDL